VRVLVDTSVWVAHFRHRNDHLVALLEAGLVVCHPYVVVEVACGTPPRRRQIVDLLGALESVRVATPDELILLLEGRALYGRGCGLVDIGLRASVLLTDHVRLWTIDRRLEAVSTELDRNYRGGAAQTETGQ
jgi:predicted nucleic acid-binding protein